MHMLFYVPLKRSLAIPSLWWLASDFDLHCFMFSPNFIWSNGPHWHLISISFVCSKVAAEAIFHRLMGPRHHSLDAIDGLSFYKVIFLSLLLPFRIYKIFNIRRGICGCVLFCMWLKDEIIGGRFQVQVLIGTESVYSSAKGMLVWIVFPIRLVYTRFVNYYSSFVWQELEDHQAFSSFKERLYHLQASQLLIWLAVISYIWFII